MDGMDGKEKLDSNREISCFVVAICRDKAEGGDGTQYFGSLGAYNYYEREAVTLGFLNTDAGLTELGLAIGAACANIPKTRASARASDYVNAAKSVLSGQCCRQPPESQ